MFSEVEILALIYLVIYLQEGENQSELISKLEVRDLDSTELDQIDIDTDDYDDIEWELRDLYEDIASECDITLEHFNKLLKMVQFVRKDEAFSTIASMSERKRKKIADFLDGTCVPEEFQCSLKSLNLPLECRDNVIHRAEKKVYCVTCGSGIYCFASRNDAEAGIKILSGNDTRPMVLSGFKISEQMRPVNCHIWTPATLEARERELDREWYSRPAFIADDVTSYFKKIQENSTCNRGTLGTKTASKLSPSQSTGCLVPFIICLTGLTLSGIVIVTGVAIMFGSYMK